MQPKTTQRQIRGPTGLCELFLLTVPIDKVAPCQYKTVQIIFPFNLQTIRKHDSSSSALPRKRTTNKTFIREWLFLLQVLCSYTYALTFGRVTCIFGTLTTTTTTTIFISQNCQKQERETAHQSWLVTKESQIKH